jgi:hypothetical protein
MVSESLRRAVKLSHLRAYQIAQLVNLHPATLSRIVNRIEPVKSGDPRVLAIGKIVGLSEAECFQEVAAERTDGF